MSHLQDMSHHLAEPSTHTDSPYTQQAVRLLSMQVLPIGWNAETAERWIGPSLGYEPTE